MVGGLGYSPRMTKIILKVKSLPKIFDSMEIRMANQSYPPKKYFGHPIEGVRGVGGTPYQPLISNCRTQEGPAYTWLFNFHTFGRTDVRTFVSLDQILVPTHSLRDKGTKGQRDRGKKGQRDKGTKEPWNLGTWELENLGT